MKLKDTLSKLSSKAIDEAFISRLESVYAVSFPDEVRRIVSIDKDTVSYDDFSLLRGLSHEEIMDASSDMAVDFVALGLLPVFDIGDNDYIVFDVKENLWYKFNIVDELKFSKAQSVTDYLS